MSEMTCEEFVALVTDYLEGVLDRETEGRFVRHASSCAGCERYLQQLRETLAVAGQLTTGAVDEEMRSTLLAAFRDWKHET